MTAFISGVSGGKCCFALSGVCVLRVVEGLSPTGRKVLISPLQTIQTTHFSFLLFVMGLRDLDSGNMTNAQPHGGLLWTGWLKPGLPSEAA